MTIVKGVDELLNSTSREDGVRWWASGLRFECVGCGRCCRGEPGAIFFTPEEGEQIRASLGLREDEFLKTYVTGKWGRPSFVERRNGDCVFYNAERSRCAIYSIRPAQCALFPFWPSVLESGAEWHWHTKNCPGMDRGHLYNSEEVRELLKRSPFQDL
ncbi:MAG: YkgJ family cysteine cluster protein [Synergistaceae bacterium]|nr:YkgJ family cysteine cluster protein [Synergistaceae bacterium]